MGIMMYMKVGDVCIPHFTRQRSEIATNTAHLKFSHKICATV